MDLKIDLRQLSWAAPIAIPIVIVMIARVTVWVAGVDWTAILGGPAAFMAVMFGGPIGVAMIVVFEPWKAKK